MVNEQPILQINARLAFYFKINPSELSDEEWALKFAQLQFVLKDEAKRWEQKR
jgi:hypothetical protein